MKERAIMLSLEKAKEFYAKGGEFRDLALGAYTEEELTKKELPKTWEEFCRTHDIMPTETIISGKNSDISCIGMRIKRNAQEDRNMCPSKKSAEAHLAMMQLHQLRDCYRQGWKPSYAFKAYAICREGTAFRVRETRSDDKFLSFPTMELAVYFLDRFKALIHLADDLI